MDKLISNSNPFSNLDTSSPKVNKCFEVSYSYRWVLVFQSWFGYWAVDSLFPTC